MPWVKIVSAVCLLGTVAALGFWYLFPYPKKRKK